jgi:hypothetical protein
MAPEYKKRTIQTHEITSKKRQTAKAVASDGQRLRIG